jgi:nucleoside-diphosphate-sugar epimerase
VNVDIIRGDLLRYETLKGLATAGCTVVHLAYLNKGSREDNLTAAENLAELCKTAGVSRLIHCSTAVVCGRVDADRVTENTPLRPLKEYEATKSRLESILLGKGEGYYETVILRPTAVFGRGGKNLLKLADDLRCGSRLANYLKSCLFSDRRMNLVFIDNVIAALAFLISTDQKVDREVFIISDDEASANNYRDTERCLMKRLGCKPYSLPVLPLPSVMLRTVLRLAGRTNTNSALVYDCGKILSRGFKKPVFFEEGLSRFADWYAGERGLKTVVP